MKFSTCFVSATRKYATLKEHVPAPYLRREFELAKAVHAEITICGLGFYELFINGNRITKTRLAPYISNPDSILYFDNYDLVPYLNDGKNVIGIILGNGMLNCPGSAGWEFDKVRYRSAPKVAFTFEAKCENGEMVEFSATDGLKCAPSPILLDDLRAGEYYDARLELEGWCEVGFDDTEWTYAIPAEPPRGECCITDIDPIVVVRELAPISIKRGGISEIFDGEISKFSIKNFTDYTAEEYLSYTEFSPNNDGYIYDFGINAAGVCRIHIKDAKPGQKLVLQYAEKLSDDGGIDLRGMFFLPKAYDHRAIYICKGGDEVWTPTFTYYGFRYVLISGIDEAQATPELLTYVVMNADIKNIAEFDCSDNVANQIWNATITSDLANFYHFPTDCPHREKNGWTADVALSAEQMLMALTPERNFREWLRNVRKAMSENGSLPGIVPTGGWGYRWGNGPAWDTVIVTVPYYTWLYRGDKAILRDNSTAIFRYVNYITTRRDKRGLIAIGLGDWCPAGRVNNSKLIQAPLVFTDTVMCVDICRKAAKIFEVLGMKAQQTFAETVAEEFREAARKYLINKQTLTANARCQTTQAMAIYYGIFDDAEKPVAFERLVEIIENDGEFIDVGVLGLRVIFHVLSEYGRADLAYKMITRPEYPSYGYMMRMGSTSLWEDFLPDEASPNSRNHHFLGDVISWFMKNLAGINLNPYESNTNEVRFAPKFIDALDRASGSHIAPTGKISAEWHRDGEDIIYTVTVPEGMYAEFCLERGWQTEDGFTWREPRGTVTYRCIRENKADSKRLVSVR